MIEVRVEASFNHPAAAVWAGLIDHENFLSGAGTRCRLTQHGAPERGGLGAVREVHSGPLRLVEDITLAAAPTQMQYRIRELALARGPRIPFDHELGEIRVLDQPGGCQVIWVSRFSVPVPLLGGWLQRRFAASTRPAFAGFLRRLGRRLDEQLVGATSQA